ncbi:MAG TPA: SRPBCC family protein [Solirubrobacteraceae bacterium]|jgi:ribosome-associated toxin RatA of RatAB toxin-antitoxin module|nr:SRPBCC family protein [Solirubrobacteraceae bacterium]
MPKVAVERIISAPAEEIWRTVNDVCSYPAYMSNVREVSIREERADGTRVSSWSVLLKGSVLEWTELEHVDETARRIDFEQLDGDLDVFRGFWALNETEGGVEVSMQVEFEIGIPLLAEMLDPVAARALHDNSQQMLTEIERRVAAV